MVFFRYDISYTCLKSYGYYLFVCRDYVRRGRAMSNMLNKIQNYVSIDGTTILYMISNFKMGDNWCFMTEHYKRNLAQALREKKRTFHIDVVQRLALQLVSAVEMLANNNIIHSGSITTLDCTPCKSRHLF